MKVLSLFLSLTIISSIFLISCGGTNDPVTQSAGKVGTPTPTPTPKPKPWENVEFMDLPQEGETLTNLRRLEFSDGINVEAQFDNADGSVERVCRFQVERNTTYKVCAEDPDDDSTWEVICETSTDGTIFNSDTVLARPLLRPSKGP